MSFELPKLKYGYDALEPYIDAETMNIHYNKHFNGYKEKLNAAIAGTDLENKSIEEILVDGFDIQAVRNNGGGYYNHALYFDIISPDGGGEAEGAVKQAINDAYGSFDAFKSEFAKAAGSRFGSGFAWLCKQEDGSVTICSTANQDNPVMPKIGCGGTPILGIDVWEHAYYLHYQNRRPDYIEAFFNVIDWENVDHRYTK